MDDIFARCVDVVALAGRPGIGLFTCAEQVLGAPPRPALVAWLQRSFSARPALFTVIDASETDSPVLHVVAAQGLRERSLGYSLLEHAPLRSQSWDILEAVGQAGQQGTLQSDLGPKVGLSPVMVHHYLGALIALRLVARRKVVLTSHHASSIDKPGVRTEEPIEEGEKTDQSGSAKKGRTPKKGRANSKVPAQVTQTSVIVLARFAHSIDSSNAAEMLSTPAGAVPASSDSPMRALFDVDVEARVQRVLEALQNARGGVIPQRDLKLIAIPDSECPQNSPHKKFVRRRHRIFRVVRAKMLKANLVKAVDKECVDAHGKEQGILPCFALAQPQSPSLEKSEPVTQIVTAAAPGDVDIEVDDDNHGQSDDEKVDPSKMGAVDLPRPSPKVLFEVDIAEQVYQTLKNSGSRGMSCLDVVSHLDGDTGLTGIEYKRTRTLLKAINKTNPIQSLQHFDGSACHKRFVLKENHVATEKEWPCDDDMPPPEKNNDAAGSTSAKPTPTKEKQSPGRRRMTNGALTTLGEQRKAIIEGLLNKRKVLQVDKIGREVAEAEGVRLHTVDSKVIRKVVASLVDSGKCRMIEVNKPSLTPTRKVTFIKLLILSEVANNGPEVRGFLSSFVKRTVVANKEAYLPPSTRKSIRKTKKRGKAHAVKKLEDVNTPVQSKGERDSAINTPGTNTSAEHPEDVITADGKTLIFDHTSDAAEGESEGMGSTGRNIPPRISAASEVEVTKTCGADPALWEDTGETTPDVSTFCKNGVSSNATILVNSVRAEENPKDARIAKLRAFDYGWIKPKMRRVRLFHEHLVRHVLGEEFFLGTMAENARSTVEHRSLETASQVEDLGRFNLHESFMAMNVRQFANIIGLHDDHGVISENTFLMPMNAAPERIAVEAKSKLATGQVRILFSILLRLGLVHSAEDSSWMLRGAGAYRDFGKGIPSGTSSHSIVFSSREALRIYWDELEYLANSVSVISSYVPDVGLRGSSDSLQMHEAAQILDVYIPARWVPPKFGNVKTVPEDELKMEIVLQTIISTVGWVDDDCLPKNIQSWTLGPLPRIPVETLYENASLLLRSADQKRAKGLKHVDIEKLMFYSRKRSRQAVNNLVLLLARKPSHDIKDVVWLRNSDVLTAQGLDNGNTVTPPAKKQKKSATGRKPPTLSSRKRRRKEFDPDHEHRDRKIRKRDINRNFLSYLESVQLLSLITKGNALVRHWQNQGVSVTGGENNSNIWRQVTESLKKSKEECNHMLDILREPDFVQRHVNILCDRLVEALRHSNVAISEDAQLSEMPDSVVDCYGEDIPIPMAVGSILGESNLQFLRKKAEINIRNSKRKSILARLRSPSSIPISNFLDEAGGNKRQRRRALTAHDNARNVHYGVIRAEETDPVWVSAHSVVVQAPSEARSCVIRAVVKALFSEPESTFNVATALYMLSRFPKNEIIAARNVIYHQNIISCCDKRRRLLEVDPPKRRPDAMFSVQSHKSVRSAEAQEISSLVAAQESMPSSALFKIISGMDAIVSQGALTATMQRVLFPGQNQNVKLCSRLLQNTAAEGVLEHELVVDFCVPSAISEVSECSKSMQAGGVPSIPIRNCNTLNGDENCAKDIGSQMTSSNLSNGEVSNAESNASHEDACVGARVVHLNEDAVVSSTEEYITIEIDDENCDTVDIETDTECDPMDDIEQVRLEDEWVHEVNIRRIREMHTLSYYQSQLSARKRDSSSALKRVDLQEVTGIVLQWIFESRSKGVTSYEINALAEKRGFPGKLTVQAVCELLKEGIVHRFACDSGNSKSGRAPAVYFLTSYDWLFVVAPLSGEKPGQISLDWTSARPISPWMRLNGEYNREIVQAVQVHIINVLARAPGTEGTSLVEKVLSWEPLLPKRAVLDAAVALHRAGIIHREVYSYKREPVTLFSNSKIGQPSEQESIVSNFPDGFELAGVDDKMRTFYSARGSCVGRLLEAEALELVAKLTK